EKIVSCPPRYLRADHYCACIGKVLVIFTSCIDSEPDDVAFGVLDDVAAVAAEVDGAGAVAAPACAVGPVDLEAAASRGDDRVVVHEGLSGAIVGVVGGDGPLDGGRLGFHEDAVEHPRDRALEMAAVVLAELTENRGAAAGVVDDLASDDDRTNPER